MFGLASSSSNQPTRQFREASSHREEDAEWLSTPRKEGFGEVSSSYLKKIRNPVSPGTFSTQAPDTTNMYAEHLPLSHTDSAETSWWEKSPFRRKISAKELEANKQLQSPFAPDFGGSGKFVPSLPRPGTFKRQDSERRERLIPLETISSENEFTAKSKKFGCRTISPKECALDYEANNPAKSETSINDDTTFTANSGTTDHQTISPIDGTFIDEANDPTKSEFFTNNDTTVDIDTPAREPSDEQIQHEVETKWILNLSMHFRDGTPQEKFFITYAETPTKWRRATVSCDYRNAPPDSLEEELKALHYQRDKSAAIYEAIRDSLPEIQFYDTVTNLKLETREGRLHVDVTEDVNELGHYPTHDFGVISWERRERWAKQIFQGLSNIHETGFVQGDFTLSRPLHASSSSSVSVAQADMTIDPGSVDYSWIGRLAQVAMTSAPGLDDSSRSEVRELQDSKKERTMLELKRFFDKPIQKAGLVKLKQGLVGFANGANIAAMADTGSRENIISAAYAKDLGLNVEGSPSSFKIGNAQKIQSLGKHYPMSGILRQASHGLIYM